jgi:phosphoribosylaminoimidazolecarboxamide formyltransferase / IMP cyclohydrolase
MEKNALLSVYDKTGVVTFARTLIGHGYTIYSSGGTAKHLTEAGVAVIDIATVTGFPPVLGHRVVTLAPQIHGGLLATPKMRAELDALGWPKFDLLYVNFYPLDLAMMKEGATFESCVESTDIGGPTMVRSAVKGGDVVVMVQREQIEQVTQWIVCGEQDRVQFMYSLRKTAEREVALYTILSAEVYERFSPFS